jgi:hypothetical protein
VLQVLAQTLGVLQVGGGKVGFTCGPCTFTVCGDQQRPHMCPLGDSLNLPVCILPFSCSSFIRSHVCFLSGVPIHPMYFLIKLFLRLGSWGAAVPLHRWAD